MTTLLVSTRKGLFVSDGTTVTGAHFVGDNVTLAMVDPRDGAWYAALDHGHFGVKLHRSDDRGGVWTEIATPAYPKQPEGVVEKNGMGKVVKWSTSLVWAMAPAMDAAGAIWAGTIPGGLFRSPDRGASWQLVESLWNHEKRPGWFGGGRDDPGIHSICVDPRDPRVVVCGISCGGVWRTADGGATWEQRATGMRAAFLPPEQQYTPDNQDPHMIVQCAAAPDVYWSQHHNGIFRSTDHCTSWQEIEKAGPSVFGFAVVVDPADPETAWFIPGIKDEKRIPVDGKLVVTRTRDGGKTFDVLSKGLPGPFAYDLVLRHAFAIAPSGLLAFGSTTGNLFASDDRGDTWRVVSNYLPPVYAVTAAD